MQYSGAVALKSDGDASGKHFRGWRDEIGPRHYDCDADAGEEISGDEAEAEVDHGSSSETIKLDMSSEQMLFLMRWLQSSRNLANRAETLEKQLQDQQQPEKLQQQPPVGSFSPNGGVREDAVREWIRADATEGDRCAAVVQQQLQASFSVLLSLFPEPDSLRAFQYLFNSFEAHQLRHDVSLEQSSSLSSSSSTVVSQLHALLGNSVSHLRDSSLSAARMHSVCRALAQQLSNAMDYLCRDVSRVNAAVLRKLGSSCSAAFSQEDSTSSWKWGKGSVEVLKSCVEKLKVRLWCDKHDLPRALCS
jgi:hypothetical protein